MIFIASGGYLLHFCCCGPATAQTCLVTVYSDARFTPFPLGLSTPENHTRQQSNKLGALHHDMLS